MKPEHIEAMDALVAEFAQLNVLRDAISGEMVEILRRHPDKTELPFKAGGSTMLCYQVNKGIAAGGELIPGCGCTYTIWWCVRGDLREEHPDGRRLRELEDAHRQLAPRIAKATATLADLLIAIGVGYGAAAAKTSASEQEQD